MINRFDGGLSKRLSSVLLSPVTAQELINVDLSYGSLKGEKDLGELFSTVEGPWFSIFQEGVDQYSISQDFNSYYVNYQGREYFSQQEFAGFIDIENSRLVPLGLEPVPFSKDENSDWYWTIERTWTFATPSWEFLESTPGTGSDWPKLYAFEYYALVSDGTYDSGPEYGYHVPSRVDNDIVLKFDLTKASNDLIGKTLKVYRKYEDGLYHLVSSQLITELKILNIIDADYDISLNEVLSPIFKGGIEKGEMTYYVTRYHKKFGIESAPIEIGKVQVYDFDGPVIRSKEAYKFSEPDVVYRLYRLGGYFNFPALVGEFEASYMEDVSLPIDLPATPLETFDYIPAQRNSFSTTTPLSTNSYMQFEGKNLPLNYITIYNVMCFLTQGPRLWFSEAGKPWAFSRYNFIDFDDEITGLASLDSGLLVFTKYKTYVVVGNSPSTLTKQLLVASQGCLYHETIQSVKNTAIWLSTDGICLYENGVQVISLDALGKISFEKKNFSGNYPSKEQVLQSYPTQKYYQESCIFSAVHDNVYYLFAQDYIYTFDLRFGGLRIKKLEFSDEVFSAKVHHDTLYASNDINQLKPFFKGSSYLPFTWVSQKIADSSISNYKSYNEVWISYRGKLKLEIFIDDKLVNTFHLENQLTIDQFKISQLYRRGQFIQFKIRGEPGSEVYEINYFVSGRTDGK